MVRQSSIAFDIRNLRFLRTAKPSRVAVDETAVQIGTEWRWCYAAIDLDTTVVLDIEVFSRHGTDPAAAFLSRLAEHHDLSEAELLVDSFGYRTALSRLGLSGHVDRNNRNHIERWFQTLKQRTDRFYRDYRHCPDIDTPGFECTSRFPSRNR